MARRCRRGRRLSGQARKLCRADNRFGLLCCRRTIRTHGPLGVETALPARRALGACGPDLASGFAKEEGELDALADRGAAAMAGRPKPPSMRHPRSRLGPSMSPKLAQEFLLALQEPQ